MKKKILGIFILLLSTNNMFAVCYYVSCSSSVILATTITTTNLEKIFMKINYKLNEIKINHNKYNDAIKKNNDMYDTNIKLKVEYLLTLQEIEKKQQLLKNIKVIDNDKSK
jgi:hypothetical protein